MNKPVVIITGASSGIGAGIASLFSQAGYRLGLLARNVHIMEALKLPNAMCLKVDVTDVKSVVEAICQLENHMGPIGCLINNAGHAKSGEFTKISHDEHEKMINVNLLGVINCIETVLPMMQLRRAGTIINISSVSDRNARPALATYAATKAAIKSLSESLRMANAKYGIRICNVAPAKIKTPMLLQSHLNDEDIVAVEDVAKAILWIYEQPPSVCIRDLVIAPTYYEP